MVAMNLETLKRELSSTIPFSFDCKEFDVEFLVTVRDGIVYHNLFHIYVMKNYRNKGIFKSIVNLMEDTKKPVMVSCIINPIVYNFLKERCWKELELNSSIKTNLMSFPTMYKNI